MPSKAEIYGDARASVGGKQRDYALIASRDWKGARDAYISESPRPTHDSVAERYNLPREAVTRVCAEENWALLRQNRQEEALRKAEAANLITDAVREVHAAPGMLGEVAVKILGGIVTALQEMDDLKMKPRARIDLLNTASFTLKNTSDALDRAGILSLGQLLAKGAEKIGGADGKGKWDKALLQQINVTVQGLVSEKPIRSAETNTAVSNAVNDTEDVVG